MKTLIKLLLISLYLSAASASVWEINKDHSEVLFKVPYLSVAKLTGRFNDFSGTVTWGTKPLSIDRIDIQIATSSIETGNKMRDGHLQGHDFFQSKVHPHILFKSQKVSLIKPTHYRAVGEMTIKDITRPFTIDFALTDSVKDTWNYENRFATFESSINRKDFKINWNKVVDEQKYLVGDEVSFMGTFQIQPKTDKTPNSKHMIPDTKDIRERDGGLFNKVKNFVNGK